MTQPTRYQQAAGMTWADLVMKWQGLTSRHACSKAHPEDRQQRLSISEHLDLLALGEVCAQRFRAQSTMHAAVMAGASWAQIADAVGSADAGQIRADYTRFVHTQRAAREDDPAGERGFSADEYAAAIRAARAADGRCVA